MANRSSPRLETHDMSRVRVIIPSVNAFVEVAAGTTLADVRRGLGVLGEGVFKQNGMHLHPAVEAKCCIHPDNAYVFTAGPACFDTERLTHLELSKAAETELFQRVDSREVAIALGENVFAAHDAEDPDAAYRACALACGENVFACHDAYETQSQDEDVPLQSAMAQQT